MPPMPKPLTCRPLAAAAAASAGSPAAMWGRGGQQAAQGCNSPHAGSIGGRIEGSDSSDELSRRRKAAAATVA
jgi:hypothetical protein